MGPLVEGRPNSPTRGQKLKEEIKASMDKGP